MSGKNEALKQVERRLGEMNHKRLDLIGQGPIADVHRAYDFTCSREVALRVIRPGSFADPDIEQIYWDGQRALANLRHPRLVGVFLLDPPNRWMVVERMTRGLNRRPGDRVPDFGRARGWLWQALEGLDHMHRAGLMHGAARLSNLMIAPDGQLKLADALALRLDERSKTVLPEGLDLLSHRLTCAGPTGESSRALTVCAPETVNPGFGPIGSASDVYTIGFALLELLVGSSFAGYFPGVADGDNDPVLGCIRWHGSGSKLPPASEMVKGLPGDIGTVLDRMIEKHVAARFESAGQALAVLRELGGEPGSTQTGKKRPSRAALPAQQARPSAMEIVESGSNDGPDAVIIAPGLRMNPMRGAEPGHPLEDIQDWLGDRRNWTRAGLAAVSLFVLLLVCGAMFGGRRTRPVSLTTNQAGAEITLDGQRIEARTPARVALTPGYHSLSFALPGFRTRTIAQVEVAEGTEVLNLGPYDLDRIVQHVRIDSTPTGAAVQVDQASTSETTPAVVSVVPGARRFVLSKPGYEPRALTIECRESDGVLDLGNFPLTPREQLGRISTEPPGAHVTIDKQELTHVTPVETPLVVGAHQVRVALEGYQSREWTLNVPPGDEVLEVPTVRLERIQRFVEVAVTSDPAGVNIEYRRADGSGSIQTLTTPGTVRIEPEQPWTLSTTTAGRKVITRQITAARDRLTPPVHFDLKPPGRMRLRCGIELVYLPGGVFSMGRDPELVSPPAPERRAVASLLNPVGPRPDARRSGFPTAYDLVGGDPAEVVEVEPRRRPRPRVRRESDTADESPKHQVRVAPFYMATTEMTQRLFELFMKYNPSYFRPGVVAGLSDTSEHPVERVPYYETEECMRRIEESEGLPRGSLRLPTEAEHEFAARGVNGNEPDPATLTRQGWLASNSGGKTRPVGRLQPNAWGLHDIVGNVEEKTSDWYGHDYYAESPFESPKGPPPTPGRREKVVRGGSILTREADFRVTDRRPCSPTAADQKTVGFRIVFSGTP